MKPDLQVALQFDAFENSGKQKPKPESGYSILKKMFHARLLDFFKTHAEVPNSHNFFFLTCSEVKCMCRWPS